MEQQNLLDPSLQCLARDDSGAGESTGDKLWREAELLFAGGVQGFGRAAVQSVDSDHIASTAGKAALGFGIGVGLACLSRRSLGLTAARLFTATTTLALANDVAMHGGEVYGALQDNWHSSRNWNQNVDTMQRTVGQFAFDSVLMGATGMAGTALQPRLSSRLPSLRSSRIPLDQRTEPFIEQPLPHSEHPLGFQPNENASEILATMRPNSKRVSIDIYGADTVTAQLADRYGKSIVRVRVETPAHGDLFWKTDGSGFFVSKDGTIATAYHVVKGDARSRLMVDMDGVTYPARLRSFNAADDLALLTVEGLDPALVRPLPVARGSNPLLPQTETLSFGYAQTNQLHVSPGSVENASFRFQGSGIPVDASVSPTAELVEIAARTVTGVSGGPVFNATTGEVIGVNTLGNASNRSYATPARTLLAFLSGSNCPKNS
ncbi:MAG: serine protease [Cyanobacteria bacterium]|nr:serine protease [Cyanobacteriota bacterium]